MQILSKKFLALGAIAALALSYGAAQAATDDQAPMMMMHGADATASETVDIHSLFDTCFQRNRIASIYQFHICFLHVA